MRYTLYILVLLNSSSQSYSQDSIHVSRIDSMVRLTEDKIINLGPHMFIKNIMIDGCYEEYIVDTVKKKLLRVKSSFQVCDTIMVFHPDPSGPPFIVLCGLESYTFLYNDNRLLKVLTNTAGLTYYVKDSVFIASEPSGLRNINIRSTEYDSTQTFWFYSNRNLYRFKELLED